MYVMLKAPFLAYAIATDPIEPRYKYIYIYIYNCMKYDIYSPVEGALTMT